MGPFLFSMTPQTAHLLQRMDFRYTWSTTRNELLQIDAIQKNLFKEDSFGYYHRRIQRPKPEALIGPYILLVPAPWSVRREDSVAAFPLDDDRLDI